LPWYLRSRTAIWLWKWLYFTPQRSAQALDSGAVNQRGAYLVEALARCGGCHTPRGPLGALQVHRRHAGSRNGPDGEGVPNITPDRRTGIGKWSRADLIYYLQTGATPGGDYAGGVMAEVIDNGTSHLSEQDLGAIADYVLSLPAIVDDRKTHKTKRARGEFE
jgi:mono/diheme cytochrome c family protein